LLLPDSAYLLERRSPLEFWYLLLAPAANPEVFAMLSWPAFVVDGNPRPPAPVLWTRFAATQIQHELSLRRTAIAKAAANAPVNPLHLLRGVWRQLQLEVIHRSVATGTVHFALTVPAVRRGVESWGLGEAPILGELQKAYEMELEGNDSGAAGLVREAMTLFARLHQPAGAGRVA
jgi:hypothetical protein